MNRFANTFNRFVPAYFEPGMDNGFTPLTAAGLAAVEEELKEDNSFCIESVSLESALV